MNSEQKELFQRLHNGRAVLADTLQNPAVSSIWNSVTDKYRDQAHFVYELIKTQMMPLRHMPNLNCSTMQSCSVTTEPGTSR